MGAGKSHTLRTLNAQGLFPLDRFTRVDPDVIKGLLPDMPGYLERDRARAGALTHKESGFIAEIATLEAMRASRSLVVDGTLRDTTWYARWFARVRSGFSHYRIAILMVTAPRERVYERARRRAAVTARSTRPWRRRPRASRRSRRSRTLRPSLRMATTTRRRSCSRR